MRQAGDTIFKHGKRGKVLNVKWDLWHGYIYLVKWHDGSYEWIKE